jgi:hypothetical protein
VSKVRSSLSLAVLSAACCALLAPAAQGATVVNGDFETGNLSGWNQDYQVGTGEWQVYSRSEVTNQLYAPPSGDHALTGAEMAPESLVLTQDVTLEPYYAQRISAVLYYESEAPIAVPVPESLLVPEFEEGESEEEEEEKDEFEQQQYRVDVIKPTASVRTTNPSDILATLFANKNGDTEVQQQTPISADLTPFAGQTVRIRIINAVNDAAYFPGLDAVSIQSTPPSNAFTKGTLTFNKKKGTASLAITVPGAGTLTAGLAKKIGPTTVTATAAGIVNVPLKAVGQGLKALKKKGKLSAEVPVTFTPTGGTASIQTFKVTLKKKLKPKHKHKPKKKGA